MAWPGTFNTGTILPSLYVFDQPPVGVEHSTSARLRGTESLWHELGGLRDTQAIWQDPDSGEARHAQATVELVLQEVRAATLADAEGLARYDDLADWRLYNDYPMFAQLTAFDVGDIDGDRHPDLHVGITSLSQEPSGVVVHRVTTGTQALAGGASHFFQLTQWEAPYVEQSSAGLSRAPIPDIDGDGATDVLLGSGAFLPEGYQPEDLWTVGSPPNPGAMVLWTGATAPGVYGRGTEAAIVLGTCQSYLAGGHAPVGRVTPSPREVVAVTGYLATIGGLRERGAIFLVDLHGVTGTVGIADVSAAVILGEHAFDQLEQAAPMGDLNQDGFDDLVVASRWAGGPGAFYLFFGPLEGVRTTATADLTIVGGGEDGVFGSALAAADMDDDGLQDLFVGAYLNSELGDRAGAVYYFSGATLLALAR